MMLSMEITKLIEQCRQGDADALGELYKAYARQMRGVCRRYISDEQTVDDVLHDAFVIIFTSFDRLRNAQRAEAWMMAITRNVAAKCKNHLEALPTVSLDRMNDTATDSSLAADEDMEKDVRGVPLSEVMKMIDKLPEGYGQVFRLSVFEGMSHKEIANMLGIEPHSSSSQLARAKKMLRKMMQQYWAAVLLLLLAPVTFLLFRKSPAIKEEKPVAAKQNEEPGEHQPTPETTQTKTEPMTAQQPRRYVTVDTTDKLQNYIAQTVDSITTDTSGNMVAQEQTTNDTVAADTTEHLQRPVLQHDNIVHLSLNKPGTGVRNRQRWAAELAYAGGFAEQNANRPFGFTETPLISATGEPPSPVTFRNWSDYAAYLSELPDDITSHTRSIIMNIALNNVGLPGNDEIVRTSHHHMPVTWSLALRHQLTDCLGLESGLSYSRLSSDFELGTNGNTISDQQVIHYVGIPMKGIYNMYEGKLWGLYGCLGLTTEIPVHSSLHTNYFVNGQYKAGQKTTLSAPWQLSTTAGLGLQLHLTPNVGFFVEPSLQYFFPTQSHIESYRTEHPLTFSLPLGIRFTW